MAEKKSKPQIVTPGEKLKKGVEWLPGRGTYRDEDLIRSKHIGLLQPKKKVVKVLPLAGTYLPQKGDNVIGRIEEIQFKTWLVDINCPYIAYLDLEEIEEFVDIKEKDLGEIFDINDHIYSKIVKTTAIGDVRLTMRERICKKLKGGRLIEVTPQKVPRLIGRGGSMIDSIKALTDCHIMIGQNGLVWLKGEREEEAVRAIRKIDKEAHKKGLTDSIKRMLK